MTVLGLSWTSALDQRYPNIGPRSSHLLLGFFCGFCRFIYNHTLKDFLLKKTRLSLKNVLETYLKQILILIKATSKWKLGGKKEKKSLESYFANRKMSNEETEEEPQPPKRWKIPLIKIIRSPINIDVCHWCQRCIFLTHKGSCDESICVHLLVPVTSVCCPERLLPISTFIFAAAETCMLHTWAVI